MLPALFTLPTPGLYSGSYLAEVVSVQDPDRLSRVQVRLLSFYEEDSTAGLTWARVVVPFAGADRGAFFIPDVGDEVLVTFLNGDPRYPLVMGGLWNGNAGAPEQLGGGSVDRWAIVGKAGTRIAIVEETPAQATISFTTPGGVTGELTDTGGGKIRFEAAGTTITVDSAGVAVQTPAKVSVQASQVEVTAGQVTVNAALSNFSGVVKCDVLQATTVIATTYTPGAGNIW